MRVLARLMHGRLQKLACAHTVAHDFGMCMQTHATHERCTSRAHTWFATLHGGVTTGTVAVGNEIQLLCSSLYVVMSKA